MKLKQQFRHTLPLDSERGLDQARADLRHSMGTASTVAVARLLFLLLLFFLAFASTGAFASTAAVFVVALHMAVCSFIFPVSFSHLALMKARPLA